MPLTMLIALLAAAPACVSIAHAEPVVVKSEAWELAVDDTTGAALSLLDADGYEYLNGSPTPLFRLLVTDEAGEQHWLSSAQAASCQIQPGASAQSLVIRYEDVRFADLSATVDVRGSGEALLLRMSVANRAGIILEEVIFPDLALKPALGDDPIDDCILAPWGDGVVLTRKLIDRLAWSPTRGYPGQCSMEFVALYDDSRGLSLTCRDAQGECKRIGYEKRDDALLLRLSIQRPFVKGVSFDGPVYALEPCRGTWAAAAHNYKQWARQQWWCHGKDDRPEWLKAMPVLLDVGLRPLGNGNAFVPLDQIGEWADRWKNALGAPATTVMLRSWEKHGVYVMPDCLPVYPSPGEFKAATDQLHSRGHRAAAMVAGLKWVIEREPFLTPHYNVTGYEGRELFEREAAPVCALDKSGEVTEKAPYFTWDGAKAFICPATQFARDLYPDVARQLAALGVDLFEFDQMNGGGMSTPCYSADHGHSPGHGPWVAQSIRNIFKTAKEVGRQVSPDFAVTMEEAGELYLGIMDTFCARNHEMATWPAMGEGSYVVPAFTYVYHGVKPSTEIDIAHSSLAPTPGLPAEMRLDGLTATARNFIWGRMLTTHMRAWEIMKRFGDDDPLPLPERMEADQYQLLRNVGAIQWGPGFEFMSEGELVPLAVPADVGVHEVKQENGEEEFIHAEPVVRASAFDLPDGCRACFYVSTADEAVTFECPELMEAGEAPITLYRNTEDGRSMKASDVTTMTLQPYDAVAITTGRP